MAWYLVAFLGGTVIGVIIGVWIDKDTVQKFGRIKIKGRSHNVTDLLDITTKKESRQSKRQIRRENRHKLDSNE